MQKFVNFLVVFACGVVFAVNLSGLVEVNAEYVASWWKVGLSVFIALVVSTRPIK